MVSVRMPVVVAEVAAPLDNVAENVAENVVKQQDKLGLHKLKKEDQEANAEEVVSKVDIDEDEPKSSVELLEYELKIDAHVDGKNYDIFEAIEVNFVDMNMT